MVYPGNMELSSEAQERVMTAFRQVVTKLQDGQREEALIGLEFVLRLDPSFAPAVNLQRQLASGAAEIDLSEIIGQLHAPTTDMINELLVEAVDDFNQRNFLDAKEKVERVLLELPGHQDARQLLVQVQDALKVETQVGQFLAQAREALDHGDPQEAANFVMMAQALDPHHRGISATLQDIHAASGIAPITLPHSAPPPADAFGVSFEPIDDDLLSLGPEEDAEPPVPPPASVRPAPPKPGPKEPPSADNAFPGGSRRHGGPQPGEGFFKTSGGPLDLGEAPSDSAYDGSWEAESLGEFSFGAEAGSPPPADDDISDLFASDGADWSEVPAPVAAAPGESDDSERIRQLLEQGEAAFARGDYQDSIDIWSRIYLLDPGHVEANQRIDVARQRKEEIDRKVEHILYEAQDAALADDVPKALELIDQILELSPTHLEAVQLRESLASTTLAAEPAPAPLAAPPSLDEDLFSDLVAEPAAPDSAAKAAPAATTAPAARRRSLPWVPAALGVGALVVILLGVYFGGKLLGGRTGDEASAQLSRSMAQGETLFAQGRVEEAIHLYQGLLENFPTSDLDRQRIERRLEEFQRGMSPATPTPVAESLTAAEEFLRQGRPLSAYGRVQQGLQSQPQDPALLATRDRILRQQPLIGPLYAAAQRGDFQTAVAVADELLGQEPALQEVASERARYLFNAAVVEMRTYNLTGAEVYLSRLTRLRPEDEEAARVLRFTEKYKTRPTDLQLNTFIKSLSFR